MGGFIHSHYYKGHFLPLHPGKIFSSTGKHFAINLYIDFLTLSVDFSNPSSVKVNSSLSTLPSFHPLGKKKFFEQNMIYDKILYIKSFFNF